MKPSDFKAIASHVGYFGLIRTAYNYATLRILRDLLGRRYCERDIHGYKMLLDLKDKGVAKDLMILGTREKEHIRILRDELKPGKKVLDLGANIGYYAMMMAKMVGEGGTVYAVEPSKSNYNLLNISVTLNGFERIVQTFNIGISDRSGIQKFYQSEKSNWHTFYPHVHSGNETEKLGDGSAIDMQVMSIGDFIQSYGNVDLIRMDVEGFEVEILRGLGAILGDRDVRPQVLFESHRPRYDDETHNMKVPLRSLFESGYYVKTLASDRHDEGGEEIYRMKGYEPYAVINTDGTKRALYRGVSNEDAIMFICDTNHVRTVLLERK